MKKMILSLALVFVALFGCLTFGGCNESQEELELYASFKTEYVVGEQLDLTNGKIAYTDSNGKTQIVEIKSEMISSFTTETPTDGARQMIVTYKDLTIEVNYYVYADVINGDLYYHNYDSNNVILWWKENKIYQYNTENDIHEIDIEALQDEGLQEDGSILYIINPLREIRDRKTTYFWVVTQGDISVEYQIIAINQNSVRFVFEVPNYESCDEIFSRLMTN